MNLLRSVVRRNETVAWRPIEDEALIVNPKDGLLYPLNAVAKRIWELLDGKKNCAEIINIIDREFEGEKSNIEQEILSFIEDLIKAGLASVND